MLYIAYLLLRGVTLFGNFKEACSSGGYGSFFSSLLSNLGLVSRIIFVGMVVLFLIKLLKWPRKSLVRTLEGSVLTLNPPST